MSLEGSGTSFEYSLSDALAHAKALGLEGKGPAEPFLPDMKAETPSPRSNPSQGPKD